MAAFAALALAERRTRPPPATRSSPGPRKLILPPRPAAPAFGVAGTDSHDRMDLANKQLAAKGCQILNAGSFSPTGPGDRSRGRKTPAGKARSARSVSGSSTSQRTLPRASGVTLRCGWRLSTSLLGSAARRWLFGSNSFLLSGAAADATSPEFLRPRRQ
jgi:hypothetical protein